jgi:CHAD domain-containing protein
VGEVRDFDVHLSLLDQVDARDEPSAVRGHREELVRRLADDARIGRELLRAYVRAERDAGLLSELEHTLSRTVTAGRPALGTAWIGRQLDARRAPLARAFRRAARRPTMGRAHRLRVQLRRTRYLFEFLATVGGVSTVRYPRRLADLQQRLGKVHDLDLLVEWVEGLSSDLRDAPWAKGLRGRRKVERRKLREELERRSLRDVIRRLGT